MEEMAQPSTKKRLLVCVQAVDADDPLFGFFVVWLEEAARQFAELTVLGLRVGRYVLPSNVTVIPLRKSGSASKIEAIWNLLAYSWQRRSSYDAVFLRGDPHYLFVAGWLWALLRKSVLFWYAHYRVSIWAKLAAYLATFVVSSSRAASVGLPRVKILGQAVDERRFPFVARSSQTPLSCLVFGRMDVSKRIEFVLRAFMAAHPIRPISLLLVGPAGTNQEQQTIIERLASSDPRITWNIGRVAYEKVPSLLAEHAILLNATEASLDKTIVEAAFLGTIPLATTAALREWLPVDLHWLQVTTEDEMTQALIHCAELSDVAWLQLTERVRLAAVQAHALTGQVQRLSKMLTP